MLDWIHSHGTLMKWLVIVSAITFVLSILAVPWMLVRIPPRYFMTAKHPHPWSDRHPALRIAFDIVKNLIGLALLVLGVLMLVLPGQGALTMLAGIILLDFPGKDRVLVWIVSRPAVLKSVNWIREKAGHEPIVVPANT